MAENVVAEIGGHCLYADELNSMIPDGATAEDSARIAEHYIMQWAKRQVVYSTARRNISDSTEIKRLVEQYRRQLIVYHYEQELVNERMDKAVSDEQMRAFYEVHGSEFALSEPVLRGRVMLVPAALADDKKTAKLMASQKENEIEELHSFALANAYKYMFSDEDFVTVSSLAPMLNGAPDINWANPPKGLVKWTEGSAAAFLLIEESYANGDKMPYQFAASKIRQIILNQRKSDFIEDFEQQMLEHAIKKGELSRKNK